MASRGGAPGDVQFALSWYRSHTHFKDAASALRGILWHAAYSQIQPDPYVVNETKKRIRVNLDRAAPNLVGALFAAHPDVETVEFAKHVALNQKIDWLLARLIDHSHDETLFETAVQRLRDGAQSHELIFAVLDQQKHNSVALEAAANWIAAYRYKVGIVEALQKRLDDVTNDLDV